jgi:hypothetical protein
MLRVREVGVDGDRAGCGIDLIVGKGDLALVRIDLAGGQDQPRPIQLARRLRLAIAIFGAGVSAGDLLKLDEIRARDREHRPDRVELDHGRERAAGLVDEVADRIGGGADAAVDRALDGRVAQVELGRRQRRLGLLLAGLGLIDAGLCLVQRGLGLVEAGLGGVAPRLEFLLALEVGLLVDQLGLRARERRVGGGGLALGAVEIGLIAPLLDLVEQLSLLDHAALLERDLRQIALDPGLHGNGFDRLDDADEALAVGDRERADRCHHHRRRRLGGLVLGSACEPGDGQQAEQARQQGRTARRGLRDAPRRIADVRSHNHDLCVPVYCVTAASTTACLARKGSGSVGNERPALRPG